MSQSSSPFGQDTLAADNVERSLGMLWSVHFSPTTGTGSRR
jgi:hypothetical protein